MRLVEDRTGLSRKLGACTEPDEPDERIFLFWFDLLPLEFVGKPEERAKTTQHRLKVVVAAQRLVAWNLYDSDKEEELARIAFWIGKTELEKRMKKRDLEVEETVQVHTMNYGKKCPCEAAAIENPVMGAEFELAVEPKIGF